MRNILKVAVVVIVAILLSASTYVLFFTDVIDNDEADDEAPTIDTITGDTTGTTGKITTVSVTFSDNVEITEAILYYKPSSDENWRNKSIINGSADIQIPSDSTEDWYYYIVIDDEAGNGPIGDPSTDGSTYYTITVTNPVEDLEHFVLVEEATATWCNNCPKVSEILHELYTSGTTNFYYVSMIQDYKTKAEDRLVQDYNIYGYPTVYIDGGYDVLTGTDYDSSFLDEKISNAENRDVPEIAVNVTTNIDESNNEIDVEILIDNYESETYTGRLKVYLTEKISVANYDGNPYHFGFLDFIADEEVSITSSSQKKVTKSYDISDIDVDNLMIIAVVFNSESIQKYSNPVDNEKPFNAYYADAADGTTVVVGGNLPPGVGITSPQFGMIYFNGRIIGTRVLNIMQLSHFNRTILFGSTKIFSVQVEDDSGIDKVEFYIDGELIDTIEEAPYNITYKKIIRSILLKKHTFEVIVYDDEGKTSSASIEFKARL